MLVVGSSKSTILYEYKLLVCKCIKRSEECFEGSCYSMLVTQMLQTSVLVAQLYFPTIPNANNMVRTPYPIKGLKKFVLFLKASINNLL